MQGSKYFLFLVILLSSFLSFWKLGEGDLNEWDESEYGQNAIEMSRNGDYIHYYYAGKPDTWNAKPPLSVWLIVLAYKIFGYNAFALRFFSAIAATLFFLFAFKLVKLYSGEKTALLTCLILLSCKAIIGFHVGRTGDADALLVFFLTAFLYYFLLFIDFGKDKAIIPASIFLGLAFYSKGMAAFILIPGLVIYLLVTNKFSSVVRSKKTWIGITITSLIIISWLAALLIKGQEYESDSIYGSSSVLETLFLHDTFYRMADPNFREADADRLFFIRYIDVRFNLWNYFFYLSLLFGIIALFKRKIKIDKILVLSICIATPVIILLTFSVSRHEWYLAPIALFIAIGIAKGVIFLTGKYKWFNVIWIGVLLFTLLRQLFELNTPKLETVSFFDRNKQYFNKARNLQVLHIPSQDYFLYLNFYGKAISINETPDYSNDLFFYDSRYNAIDTSHTKLIECKDNYCLAVSK